jgi:hypothetical protein
MTVIRRLFTWICEQNDAELSQMPLIGVINATMAAISISSNVMYLHKSLSGRIENMLFENENQYACWDSILAMAAVWGQA